MRVAVDEERRAIAWRAEWEAGPFVHLHDAATGGELGRVVCASHEITPTAAGLVLLDQGWRVDGECPPRLLVVTRVGMAVQVLEQGVAPDTSLIGVAPDGDRMILSRPGRCELRRRSEEGSLRTWDWYSPGVDWEAGCVWGTEGREVSLEALDGSWSRRLQTARWSTPVGSVGSGILRLGYHGVRLFRPRGPLLTVLRPTSQPIWALSAGEGGRSVCAVLGWKPQRFEIDLDAGHVLAAPAGIERAERLTSRCTSPSGTRRRSCSPFGDGRAASTSSGPTAHR